MSGLETYRTAMARGVRLTLVDGQVRYDAPAAVITPDLLAELREGKDELLLFLSSPGVSARQIWQAVLKEVAESWEQRVIGLSEEEKDALWVDDALDQSLQAAVRHAILAQDLERTHIAVERWRGTWQQCVCERQISSGPASCAAHAAPRPVGADEVLPCFTDTPGEAVDPVPPSPTEAGEPATAPIGYPDNLSVLSMFDEANVRFAEHLQPDTFTTWLEKRVPKLAQEWPDAPSHAAWFDWRLRLPETARVALGEAWELWLRERISNALGPAPAPWPEGNPDEGANPLLLGDEMKVSKFLSRYLRAADVTQPVTITIDRIGEEAVGPPGKSERKLVLQYKGGSKAIALSQTMVGQFVEIFKSDDSDDWIGKRVVMFNDPEVEYDGKRVGGIRFRAAAPLETL